ncbi:hypothetical protein U1Q18_009387, partial [Sarracenia purpurea var. burkii]
SFEPELRTQIQIVAFVSDEKDRTKASNAIIGEPEQDRTRASNAIIGKPEKDRTRASNHAKIDEPEQDRERRCQRRWRQKATTEEDER